MSITESKSRDAVSTQASLCCRYTWGLSTCQLMVMAPSKHHGHRHLGKDEEVPCSSPTSHHVSFPCNAVGAGRTQNTIGSAAGGQSLSPCLNSATNLSKPIKKIGPLGSKSYVLSPIHVSSPCPQAAGLQFPSQAKRPVQSHFQNSSCCHLNELNFCSEPGIFVNPELSRTNSCISLPPVAPCSPPALLEMAGLSQIGKRAHL